MFRAFLEVVSYLSMIGSVSAKAIEQALASALELYYLCNG